MLVANKGNSRKSQVYPGFRQPKDPYITLLTCLVAPWHICVPILLICKCKSVIRRCKAIADRFSRTEGPYKEC